MAYPLEKNMTFEQYWLLRLSNTIPSQLFTMDYGKWNEIEYDVSEVHIRDTTNIDPAIQSVDLILTPKLKYRVFKTFSAVVELHDKFDYSKSFLNRLQIMPAQGFDFDGGGLFKRIHPEVHELDIRLRISSDECAEVTSRKLEWSFCRDIYEDIEYIFVEQDAVSCSFEIWKGDSIPLMKTMAYA